MAAGEIIRLIHPLYYSYEKSRFKSEAIESSDDGLSVIELDCCVANSGDVCTHVRKYYPSGISGEPPVFLRLKVDQLPATASLRQETSDTGDECHHLVNDVPKSVYRNIVKNTTLDKFEICDEGIPRPLRIEDIRLQNAPPPDK